jgi:hypothetical protein
MKKPIRKNILHHPSTTQKLYSESMIFAVF